MPEYEAQCICGHIWDEHDPRSASCTIEGCLCACFEADEDVEERRAGLSPTARTEIEAAFLERVRTALCDACVLMHGWHQDGTDWSAWDESVYKAAQAALAETMERASVLGAESTKEGK